MSKLRSRIEQLRNQPHAARERYAVLAAIILAAILLGAWYGIRLGINRRQQAANDLSVSQEAKPFSVVGNAWGDLMDYVEGVSANLPEWRNPFQKAPTSTPLDVSIFQSSPASTTTDFSEEPEGGLGNLTGRDLQEASVQYGFDIEDIATTTQDE